jgi:hypothetical protein
VCGGPGKRMHFTGNIDVWVCVRGGRVTCTSVSWPGLMLKQRETAGNDEGDKGVRQKGRTDRGTHTPTQTPEGMHACTPHAYAIPSAHVTHMGTDALDVCMQARAHTHTHTHTHTHRHPPSPDTHKSTHTKLRTLSLPAYIAIPVMMALPCRLLLTSAVLLH